MEYMMVNGYQIPALTLNEPPMPEIGKYGSLRRNFLRENAPVVFDEMLLEGTLYPHLAEMDNAVHRQIEQTMQTLMQQSTAPNRQTDPMGWTQWMAVSVEFCGRFSLPMPDTAAATLDGMDTHIPPGEERKTLEEIRELSVTIGDTVEKAHGLQRGQSAPQRDEAR